MTSRDEALKLARMHVSGEAYGRLVAGDAYVLARALIESEEERERVRLVLDTIYSHDRTPEYKYGESLRSGVKPRAGQRFMTPRELVAAFYEARAAFDRAAGGAS